MILLVSLPACYVRHMSDFIWHDSQTLKILKIVVVIRLTSHHTETCNVSGLSDDNKENNEDQSSDMFTEENAFTDL